MSLRRLVLRLIMVFAALAAGAWPAMADWTPPVSQPHHQAQTSMPAMVMDHGDHDAMMAAHVSAPCDQPAAKSTGHCASMVMACGSGIVGTEPQVFSLPQLIPVDLVLWSAGDDSLVALSVLPARRPPRSFL